MNNLKIEGNNFIPSIEMDPKGFIKIEGKSYPENSYEFYKPVIDWLNEYFKNPANDTEVIFNMDYFNSTTSKVFYDIFDILEENKDKTNLHITWFYKNETMKECGEDFKEDFEDLNIELKEKVDK